MAMFFSAKAQLNMELVASLDYDLTLNDIWGYTAPDFAKVAQAYGVEALHLDDPGKIPEALEFFWNDPEQPVLLHVAIHPEGNVYPKIAFGHPLTEMEPEFKPLEMEGT